MGVAVVVRKLDDFRVIRAVVGKFEVARADNACREVVKLVARAAVWKAGIDLAALEPPQRCLKFAGGGASAHVSVVVTREGSGRKL